MGASRPAPSTCRRRSGSCTARTRASRAAADDEPAHLVSGLHHVADEHVRAEWLAVPADGHRDGHLYGRQAAQAERLRGDRVRVYWWSFIRIHLRAHGARHDPAAALRDVAVFYSL